MLGSFLILFTLSFYKNDEFCNLQNRQLFVYGQVLEKTLRLLFETKDVSLVKRYVCRQFTKVMSGRISVQDLTFAREYRGAAGYRPGACVPALELAK